jgi:hypothetical protein
LACAICGYLVTAMASFGGRRRAIGSPVMSLGMGIGRRRTDVSQDCYGMGREEYGGELV